MNRCKAVEGHASLIFSRHNDIRKYSLEREETTALVNNTKFASTFDFIFRTRMLFWSDLKEKKIYK